MFDETTVDGLLEELADVIERILDAVGSADVEPGVPQGASLPELLTRSLRDIAEVRGVGALVAANPESWEAHHVLCLATGSDHPPHIV